MTDEELIEQIRLVVREELQRQRQAEQPQYGNCSQCGGAGCDWCSEKGRVIYG